MADEQQSGGGQDQQSGSGGDQQQQSGGGQQQQQSPTIFDQAYVDGIRRESAGYRTQLREAQTTLQGLQNVNTENMSLKGRVQALEAANAALKIEITGIDVASKAGAKYPTAVLKLIDQTKFEYDDKGDVKNLRELINSVKNAYPDMFRASQNSANGGSGQNNPPGDGLSMNDYIRGVRR